MKNTTDFTPPAGAVGSIFTAGEIITAGTGKLCCQMDGAYRIMSFLTGEALFTHQLPRAFKLCEPWVRSMHPWLLKLDESKCTPETWKEWLADAVARYGDRHYLLPLPSGTWLPIDPVAEAEMLFGKDRVSVVEAPRSNEKAD